MSTTLAAVADPTRRAILRRLVSGPAPVRDLARPFRISQQAVSKHLAYLERARLVRKRRDGRLHICTINPAPLRQVAEWAEEYRRIWEGKFRQLDALLEEMKAKQTKPDHSKRK